MNDNQKLAFSAYTGKSTEHTKEEMDQAIRNKILEVCGGVWNVYAFLDNKYKVFALISELMPVSMHASLAGKYDRFCEFKDTAMGDKNYFEVEDNQVYPMYTAARGNMDIERQHISNGNFSVTTAMKVIKFYDEFDRFMAGKMDFARLTEKATTALGNHMGLLISGAIYGSYSALGTDYKITGAFDADVLADLIAHVKAANSAEKVQIWGTDTALGNISDGFGYSERQKESANNVGYYDSFRGSDMFAMPQAYNPQTTTFAVNTSFAIILPADEKIVKAVFEGDAAIVMSDGTSRNDLQPEITYGRRCGVAALTTPAGKYAMYIFS